MTGNTKNKIFLCTLYCRMDYQILLLASHLHHFQVTKFCLMNQANSFTVSRTRKLQCFSELCIFRRTFFPVLFHGWEMDESSETHTHRGDPWFTTVQGHGNYQIMEGGGRKRQASKQANNEPTNQTNKLSRAPKTAYYNILLYEINV